MAVVRVYSRDREGYQRGVVHEGHTIFTKIEDGILFVCKKNSFDEEVIEAIYSKGEWTKVYIEE